MKYSNVVKGDFLSRPNRFIAKVKIGDEIHTVHVKNTGRCKELLVPNCTVYLAEADNPNRKTKYDLIAVEKQRTNGKVAKASLDVKVADQIEIQFGTKSVKVEVLDVQDTSKKEEAKELYKYI